MSLNFAAVTQVTFNNGAGQRPASLPIQLCKPIGSEGPREIRLDIPWTDAPYSASFSNRRVVVNCDLAGQQVATPLSAIRYVKIDNTYNDVPVSVQFTDTLDTVICPANSIIGAQIMSNSQNFVVFGDGFFTGRAPITSVFLSNTPQQPFYQVGAGRFKVVHSLTDVRLAANNAAVYNFNVVRFGAVASDRVLLAVCCGERAAAGLNSITSVTVAGVSAGGITQVDATLSNGLNYVIGFAPRFVPAGISGNVDIVFANTQDYTHFALYRLINLTNRVPFSNMFDYTTTNEMCVCAPEAIPGGAVFYAAHNLVTSTSPPLYTGSPNLDAWQRVTNLGQPSFYSSTSEEPATLSLGVMADIMNSVCFI